MALIHELEALRAELQQGHIEFVWTEINLAVTFMDMSR
jgi:hypothetical protein